MDNSRQFKLRSGILELSGDWDVVYRPGAILARRGEFITAPMPVRPGKWYSWPFRAMESDRYAMRRGILTGTCWVGGTGVITQLPPAKPELGPLNVITEALLCYPTSKRRGGMLQRVIPGSFRGALATTQLESGDGGLPVFCLAHAELLPIHLADGETLQVNPKALAAWQCTTPPRGFLQKLRLRDLILPRLPGDLTLEFTGPGVIWLRQLPQTPPKRRGLNRG